MSKPRTSIYFQPGPAPTPGPASAPVSVTGNNLTGDTLAITLGSAAPTSQSAFTIINSSGNTIMQVTASGPEFYGLKVGAYKPGVSPTALDGTQTPVCLDLPDNNSTQTNGFQQQWAGTGAPAANTVGAAEVGDIYYRRDGSAGSYIYICNIAGSPGNWVGVL